MARTTHSARTATRARLSGTGGIIRRPGVERMQERIIEAAVACFRRQGVEATRMEDIADEAGLQRPNLYRYFPTKGAVIRGAIIQEMHATHEVRRKEVELDGPVAPLLVKSLAIGLEMAQKNEIIAFNLSKGAVDLTLDMLAGDDLVLTAEAEYWQPLLAHGRRRKELRPGLTDERIIRWFLSNQFSFLDRPRMFDDGGMRSWIEDFVVPAVLTARGLAALD